MKVYALKVTYYDEHLSEYVQWPTYSEKVDSLYSSREAAEKAAEEKGIKQYRPRLDSSGGYYVTCVEDTPYFVVEEMEVFE